MVWLVTYWDDGKSPETVAFSDEVPASAFREWIDSRFDNVLMDSAYVLNGFDPESFEVNVR